MPWGVRGVTPTGRARFARFGECPYGVTPRTLDTLWFDLQMRIAYLGPAGTFTEDALGEAMSAGGFEPLRTATIPDAILAVERGEAERALVPIENSLEGSVRPTLDTLAFD